MADRAREVERLVAAALDSQIVRAAVTASRCWREVYVGAPVAGRALEGFVDLLIEGPDGLTVVDYKTDAVHDDDLDAIGDDTTGYKAPPMPSPWSRLWAGPWCAACSCSCGPARPWPRQVDDLERAKAQVRAVLSRI